MVHGLIIPKLGRLLLALTCALLAGCSSMGYYWQSIDGEARVLNARQPITDVLADPQTPERLKQQLQTALEIRDFASRELKLPQNFSYRTYADLGRPAVVWNVFATEEFSVQPQRWCFPVAGCVAYRGYFSRADADAFAGELRAQGMDVMIGSVPAYSTLGWMDDPVLNTFIGAPEYDVARLIFHELAHQKVYAPGDSEFNESFAVTVELEGVRRWIDHKADAKMRADFERSSTVRDQIPKLLMEYRAKLAALYQEPIPPTEMRARKAQVFASLEQDYHVFKERWNGYSGYDRMLAAANNATVASVATYTALVPEFQELLAKHHGDLEAFYSEVKSLSVLNKQERTAIFAQLQKEVMAKQAARTSAPADSQPIPDDPNILSSK